MAWEENSRICLHTQLIAILSRIGVVRLHPFAFIWLLSQTDPKCKMKFTNSYPNTCINGLFYIFLRHQTLTAQSLEKTNKNYSYLCNITQ